MKSTKKTLREWYDYLPSPMREQAIKNTKKLDNTAPSLECAIDEGMYWAKTPEGQIYWSEFDKILNTYEIF